MPNYVFTGTVPMIFGGFKYGDGITVAGVTDKDGETVVLFPDAFVTSQVAIDHAYLTLMPDAPLTKSSKSDPTSVESPVTADGLVTEVPLVAENIVPEIVAESLSEANPEPTVVDAPADSTPTPSN